MDNKLSKPAGQFTFEPLAERWHHIKHGEKQNLEGGPWDLKKLYSQEYVSALLARIADLESYVDVAALALSIADLRKYGVHDECPTSLSESIDLVLHEFGRNRAELEAKDKRIAEIEGSHKKLRETLAAVHNTITGGGAYTSLAGILTAVKRAYLESSDASACTVTVEGDE